MWESVEARMEHEETWKRDWLEECLALYGGLRESWKYEGKNMTWVLKDG